MAPRRARNKGFTLIELVAVMVIMAIVLGVALPNLWPLVMYAGLEGEANRIGNFGRAAISQCTLMREHYIVKVDLGQQKYHAVLQPTEADLEADAEEKTTESGEEDEVFDPYASLKDVDPLERARQFREHMEVFTKMALEVRASRIEQDDFSLEGVGPEFDEFKLDADEEEKYTVKLPLLEPHRLPQDVKIESVKLGSKSITSGVAEIEILPLGLLENAVFYLRSDDGEYYTVVWDAITGGARMYAGKEEV